MPVLSQFNSDSKNPVNLFAEAQKLGEEKKYEEAIKAAESALALFTGFPDKLQCSLLLAQLKQQSGDKMGALEKFITTLTQTGCLFDEVEMACDKGITEISAKLSPQEIYQYFFTKSRSDVPTEMYENFLSRKTELFEYIKRLNFPRTAIQKALDDQSALHAFFATHSSWYSLFKTSTIKQLEALSDKLSDGKVRDERDEIFAL